MRRKVATYVNAFVHLGSRVGSGGPPDRQDTRPPLQTRFSLSFFLPFAVCVAALTLAGCSRHDSTASTATASAAPQILRVSQRNEPADLDPAVVTLPDDFFVIRALSEGLLAPNPAGGAPLPAAAESFGVSTDGLTYTFHLRANGKWSNGDPVTAADFVESYHRALAPATAARKADLFFPVKNAGEFARGQLTDFSAVGFHALDEHTLAITLVRPMPQFPAYVATGTWIPVHPKTVAQFGRTWTQPEHYVGNGPFVLVEWRQHQRIVVRKNPLWRDAQAVRLAEIQFIHFDDDDTEERSFRAGQLDVTMTLPRTKLPTYAKEHPEELHRGPLAETRYLAFNTQRPALADARVRRALALALDRRKFVDRVILGGQPPASRFTPPPLLPSPKPLAGEMNFASDEARTLLTSAGFPGGKGFPTLELSAWSASQSAALEAMQAMWHQELGIETTITIREAKVHLAALQSGGYDIAFATTVPLLDLPDPLSLLENFTSDSPSNQHGWHSAEFDRLIASAMQQRELAPQAADLVRAETVLLAEAPVTPLYFNVHNWLMSPHVQGWQEDALWARSYANVSLNEK